MKKTILLIAFTFVLTAVPVATLAAPNDAPEPEALSNAQNDIRISVRGTSIRVTGAAGMVVDVYNVTGQKVKSIKLNASDETVNTGLPRGCYIVKVGDVVRKVSIG